MREYEWPEFSIILFTILRQKFVLVDRPVNTQTLILKEHSIRYKTTNTAIMRAFTDSVYFLFPSCADRIQHNTSGSYIQARIPTCLQMVGYATQ